MCLLKRLKTLVLIQNWVGGWHNDKLTKSVTRKKMVNALVATPGLDARLVSNACVCQN